jgi:hypothetical protein
MQFPVDSCWPQHSLCTHREYIGRVCKLWGEPAKIVKSSDGYALIAPLDPSKGSVPYSWVAVFNTMANRRGNFQD